MMRAMGPHMAVGGGIFLFLTPCATGAQIKVSQKGEYAPGTTNRIVNIIGSQQAAAFAYR